MAPHGSRMITTWVLNPVDMITSCRIIINLGMRVLLMMVMEFSKHIYTTLDLLQNFCPTYPGEMGLRRSFLVDQSQTIGCMYTVLSCTPCILKSRYIFFYKIFSSCSLKEFFCMVFY